MHEEYDDIDHNALAKGVIAQAIEDCTTWNTKGRGNGGASWHEIKDARYLLTATDGDWKESREIWCGLAGYDPEVLRVKVLQALKTGQVFRRSDFTSDETQSSGG